MCNCAPAQFSPFGLEGTWQAEVIWGAIQKAVVIKLRIYYCISCIELRTEGEEFSIYLPRFCFIRCRYDGNLEKSTPTNVLFTLFYSI